MKYGESEVRFFFLFSKLLIERRMELLGRINEKLKARLSSCDELRF